MIYLLISIYFIPAIAKKIEVDALGLAQIHRKVSDEATRKVRHREREREKQGHFNADHYRASNSAPATPASAFPRSGEKKSEVEFASAADFLRTQALPAANDRGGVRKKYQVLQ